MDRSNSNAAPLLAEQNASYLQMEAAPAALPEQQMITPQPQQVVMVHQPQQPSVATSIVQPYQVNPVQQNEDIATENYLYTGRVGDLTICHWLACLFCNCCFCGLIGLILNEVVNAAKRAGYHKLAYYVSQKAKCWMITACVCTLIPWIIICIIFAGGWITTDISINNIQNDMDTNP